MDSLSDGLEGVLYFLCYIYIPPSRAPNRRLKAACLFSKRRRQTAKVVSAVISQLRTHNRWEASQDCWLREGPFTKRMPPLPSVP